MRSTLSRTAPTCARPASGPMRTPSMAGSPILVPSRRFVMAALTKRLDGTKIGDPAVDGVRMGPLAGRAQVGAVRDSVERIAKVTEKVYGNIDNYDVVGADRM